jgi:hypothetical protein
MPIRIRESWNPAVRKRLRSSSVFRDKKSERIINPASAPICCLSACAKIAYEGLCLIDRMVLNAKRPFDLSTRCISCSAANLLGKNWRPCWQNTTSNEESSYGISLTSPFHHSILWWIFDEAVRATSSIPSLRSRPMTVPLFPTRSEAVRATIPVPQATSSTCSPAFRAASSIKCWAPGQEERYEIALVCFGATHQVAIYQLFLS